MENTILPIVISSVSLICLLYAFVRGKKGFTSKRIVLFSNVCHEFGDDQLDDIIGSLKEAEIELDIMSVYQMFHLTVASK